MFLYYTRHGVNFHSCEKQIFKSFGYTEICNDSKWTQTSRNEVMQPTTSNNDSRPIFPCYVDNQAGFDNPFINSFIYLDISKMSFIFEVLLSAQGSVSIKSERLIFAYKLIIVGSWKLRFKILEFKCLWNQEGCSP